MPGGLICPHCRRYTSADDTHCNHCGKLTGGATVSKLVRGFGGIDNLGTKFLLGLCIAMYGAEMLLSLRMGEHSAFAPASDALIELGALWDYEQWWRVASATIMHGSLLHIGMNGLGMIALGRTMEDRFGAWRTITVFFITGILGFVLSLWMHNGHQFSLGASGGLFGFVGADLGFMIAKRSAGTRAFVTRSIVFAILWSLLPMIDFWAHMGGLASGLALGWLLSQERRAQGRTWMFAATAVFLTVLTLGAVARSVMTYEPPEQEQDAD